MEDRAQAPDGADAAVPPAAPAEVPAPVVAAKAPSEVKHTDATHESHEKHAPQERVRGCELWRSGAAIAS